MLPIVYVNHLFIKLNSIIYTDLNGCDLTAYIYTGSHQHCAEVVLSGEYDVCGMQDTLAETMEKQGLLRILYRSPYFPGSGIVANDQVSTEVIKVVKQALLDFQPLGKDKDIKDFLYCYPF
jgi:ABC-type phosphate/phosphonate transport system substrate-binding protein